MAEIITVDDVPQHVVDQIDDDDLLELMVAGLNARASRVAPCLDGTPTVNQLAEAKVVLLGALSRWGEQGSGAWTQQTAGPFSVTADTRSRGGFNLWPTEISTLEEICSMGAARQAFTVDTAPEAGVPSGPDWWGYETPNWTGPDLRADP